MHLNIFVSPSTLPADMQPTGKRMHIFTPADRFRAWPNEETPDDNCSKFGLHLVVEGPGSGEGWMRIYPIMQYDVIQGRIPHLVDLVAAAMGISPGQLSDVQEAIPDDPDLAVDVALPFCLCPMLAYLDPTTLAHVVCDLVANS